MLDWIVEGLRWIVWGFTSACLTLMDVCYGLCKDISAADFLSSSEVWQWYYVFMSFLGTFVVIRMLAVYLKFSFDEEFRDKVSGTHFINKLISIALITALLPFFLTFVSEVSVWSINNIGLVVGTPTINEPSTFIVTSFMNTDNGEFNENGEWVEGERITYTIEDIDINEEGTGDADFKYFDNIADLFIIAIIGVTSAIMLIINGIQIGKRMYAIVMKVIIAPLPISSLIVPGDETFSMWRKMLLSDYILNFFQTLMIIVVMILSGSKVIQQFGVWAQIISFIAGLLLLLSGVPELARILGGDTSQANVLQQIASFRLATRGVGNTIGRAGAKIGHAMGTTIAGATYGAGRVFGGQSINEMQSVKVNESNQSGGFMGGSQYENQTSSGYSFQNSKENSNINLGGMNDHSQIRQEDHMNVNQKDSFSNAHTAIHSDNYSRENPNVFRSEPLNQRRTDTYQHSSREGTLARKISDKANSMTGIKGYPARFATNSTKHIYQASMQRVQNAKLYKTAGGIKKLASPHSEWKGVNHGK